MAFSSLDHAELVDLESEFLDMCEGSDGSDGEINRRALKGKLRLRSSLDAADLLEGVDSSCDGTLSFSEWLAAASRYDHFSSDGAQRAFDTLDSDRDGLISRKDLLEVLPNVFSEDELIDEIVPHDINNDGFIDFDEFCALLKGTVQEDAGDDR